MTRKIWISSALALATAMLVLAPMPAFAGSPLLSGYGGPGAGEQAVIGSTLIGGSRGGGAGGSSGSGGSGGAGLPGPAGASTSASGGTSSTGSGSARGLETGTANAGSGSVARGSASKGRATAQAPRSRRSDGRRRRLRERLRVSPLTGLHSQRIPFVRHIERRCAPTNRDPRHTCAGGRAHPAAFPATELTSSDR